MMGRVTEVDKKWYTLVTDGYAKTVWQVTPQGETSVLVQVTRSNTPRIPVGTPMAAVSFSSGIVRECRILGLRIRRTGTCLSGHPLRN